MSELKVGDYVIDRLDYNGTPRIGYVACTTAGIEIIWLGWLFGRDYSLTYGYEWASSFTVLSPAETTLRLLTRDIGDTDD